jgi:hypothetical protein
MLEVGVAAVELAGVDAVLGADHLPEGTTPLQSTAEVREGRGRERRSGCADGVTGKEAARPTPAGGKAEMGADANKEERVAAAAVGVRVWLRS